MLINFNFKIIVNKNDEKKFKKRKESVIKSKSNDTEKYKKIVESYLKNNN